ncbi:MAG: DUF4357 domain-containing protein [Candidatus Melainabacteria bacterium HGW-Melainabacteria-1]|nr:MAG: DUF4357 domain-containing protein [Candidatus Melainabacteria bacterium HGW-Melainabacteria-1]
MRTTTGVPFTLRIFVAGGDPEGLRIVERSNWVGKALMFPRLLLQSIKQRSEFGQAGVYLLLGPREDADGDLLYIGEGDMIKPRLESHYSNKDFWDRAVFFVDTSGQLNKAHVQFLEARLIQLARSAKRIPLENGNVPQEPSLSEFDRADMEVFLQNMLDILPVLGVNAFEQAPQRPVQNPATPTAEPDLFYLRAKGIEARGFESSQGFTVLAGSQAVLTEGGLANYAHWISQERQKMQELGVLVQESSYLRFTQDYSFRAPSTAAAAILARGASGPREWMDSQGRTMKELRELALQR